MFFCNQIGIDFASTPYSEEEVEYLLEKCKAIYKNASMEINNHEFLKFIASKKTAIILSTGMSTYDELLMQLKL